VNIDERIQTIAESLELVASLQHDHEKRHAQDFEEVMSLHRDNEKRLAQVMDTMNRLGRIIEIHDQRLDEHEGRIEDLEQKH